MEVKGVKIGDKFEKQLNKNKYSVCEVVDFIERRSVSTGELISVECWAKSIDGKFFQGKSFEVAFTTVKRGLIIKAYNKELNNLDSSKWESLINSALK